MAEIVFDAETDGLDPSRVWCVATSTEDFFTDAEDFGNYVGEHHGDTFIGHNILAFDVPVLGKLWNTDFEGCKLVDTLVLSRLANPSREGGHSMENWGQILGQAKVEHEDWSHFSPDMERRCKEDVKLNVRMLTAIERELEGFSQQSRDLEHEVAKIIDEQVQNGWLLDQEAAFMLLAELKEKKFELEDEVHKTFRPQCKAVKEVHPKTNQDGRLSVVGLKYLGDDCLSLVGGVHTRVEWQEFNLGSRKQIAERLIGLGWVPPKYTPPTKNFPKGQPIVDENTLEHVRFPEGQLIADYLTIQKRIAMVQSWLDFVGEDGRVHGEVNSNGAVTGRMTHYNPNVAQTTAGSKIYGTEMRSCWIARPGYKIVGGDASGLELRMLAHYMNDEDYIREVVHGDVHTANQKAAGLDTRDQAKTFIYAFLYGAGDAKIGLIAGGSKSDGRRLKARFLQRTPALKRLKERVEKASGRGWLKGIDGRRIRVRSRHAALNSLLQGAGAVVMKVALVELYKAAKAEQLDFKLVGNIHDEIQAEVLEEHSIRFGELVVQSVRRAGEILNLRCPLDAEYKIGNSWAETH